MQRSLYSGVTGLTNHQLILDNTANNLANISTSGFKSSRITFSTALTQTQSSGAAPGSSTGGQNPRQVGLGVRNSSVDIDMRQGALQSTGRNFDLSIQGNGFFQVTNLDGSTAYTRVGNFGFDSKDTMVDLGTGLKVQGKVFDSTGQASGAISDVDIAAYKQIDAKSSLNVTFQGNLSSSAKALQGTKVQSVLPLINAATGAAATEATVLKDLQGFTGGNIEPASPNNIKTLWMFGTKADGTAYAGSFTVNPWQNTVQNLTDKMNAVLSQGSESLGTVKVEAGSLLATAASDLTGFSVFLGEKAPITNNASPTTTPTPTVIPPVGGPLSAAVTTTLDPTSTAGVIDPTITVTPGTLTAPVVVTATDGTASYQITIPAGVYTTANNIIHFGNTIPVQPGATLSITAAGDPADVGNVNAAWNLGDGTGATTYTGSDLGTSKMIGSFTVNKADAGLLSPTFTIGGGTFTGTTNLKVKVNGKDVGFLTVPPGTYVVPDPLATPPVVGNNTFSLASLPHVKAGDVVSYEMYGTMDLGGGTPETMSVSTKIYQDSSTGNLTSDRYSAENGSTSTPDGVADFFQEGSQVDVNAWVYDQGTNATMDWYRMRFVPEKVTTSIQVYDSVGGAHTLEARFFRTGTRSEVSGGKTLRFNSWDVMYNISAKEGTFTDPLITGIEFDEKGRYVGNGKLGSTVHGGVLSNPTQYKGVPADNTVGIQWAATGSATLTMDFGGSGTTTGLTGFGSPSTAAATEQDGFSSGVLDTMSVSSSGKITGLYTNGKSRDMYQLEVATFRNAAGLISAGQNLWQVSANSGEALARVAGEGGAGTITSGALEGSNVDIAGEFTKLITAQRGFQVNSRVIQTTDSVLQELTGLIRG